MNWYSPDFSSLARLEREHAADEDTSGSSITPSRVSRSAMSRMPPRGMLTILSSCSGPGSLEALLAHHKRDARADGHEEQQGKQQIADDHERIARALRAARRHRHAFGLEAQPAGCAAARCRSARRPSADLDRRFGSLASTTVRAAGCATRPAGCADAAGGGGGDGAAGGAAADAAAATGGRVGRGDEAERGGAAAGAADWAAQAARRRAGLAAAAGADGPRIRPLRSRSRLNGLPGTGGSGRWGCEPGARAGCRCGGRGAGWADAAARIAPRLESRPAALVCGAGGRTPTWPNPEAADGPFPLPPGGR